MAENTASPAAELRERADRRMADALAQSGLPDPRERYRDWLRELRARDESGFRKALEYFEGRLVPALAVEHADPLVEWTEYGLRLAQRLRDGAPAAIDESGLSRPCEATAPLEHLVLHLPTSTRHPALVVRLPARLSPAQAATVELLVGA